MIIDPLLFDTHKRAKAGTAKIVSWLATRSKATKLVDNVLPTPVAQSNAGGGRLKGSARKKTRRKTQTYQVRISYKRSSDASSCYNI